MKARKLLTVVLAAALGALVAFTAATPDRFEGQATAASHGAVALSSNGLDGAAPEFIGATTTIAVPSGTSTTTGTTTSTTTTAGWLSAPALAPDAPAGVSAAKYPVALGHVGQISFWAPNRGLLITAGTDVVPAGLYAYNGVSWHQLSTVCGGSDGRIAWAGPDGFWTISDQRGGQQVANSSSLADISLCHFQNGQVVGSYAMALGQTNSYEAMDAAACAGPDDCWFGGVDDPNGQGAFHLYWNGTTLSVIWGSQDHQVTDLAAVGSQLYEAVAPAIGDTYAGSESYGAVPILHLIESDDSSNPFHDYSPINSACTTGFCAPLPNWGTGARNMPVSPAGVGTVKLSVDELPSSTASGGGLWVLAAAAASAQTPPSGYAAPHTLLLRDDDGAWSQVVPNLGSLPAGQTQTAIAAEAGTDYAWVAGDDGDGQAAVERLSETGTVDEVQELGSAQGVGPRGAAQAIACPAANDCWLASSQGWLFHYTDGAQLTQDSDPSFQSVITYRPPDSGLPQTYSDTTPTDSSLNNQQTVTVMTGPTTTPVKRRAQPVVYGMRSRLVGARKTTLQLSFTLRARARVRLAAELVTYRRTAHGRRREVKVLASTAQLTLGKGRHVLKLVLNPACWPNKLDFTAVPIAGKSHPKIAAQSRRYFAGEFGGRGLIFAGAGR